jgi:hypothetical protein
MLQTGIENREAATRMIKKNSPKVSEGTRAFKRCLSELLNAELDGTPAEIHTWRARNGRRIPLVEMLRNNHLVEGDQHYHITFYGLLNAPGKRAAGMRIKCQRVFKVLSEHLPAHPKEPLPLADLARQARITSIEALQCARFLTRSPAYLSVQDADPANIRVTPNEQYVTFKGFAEVKQRAREEAQRPRNLFGPIGLGADTMSHRTLAWPLELSESEAVRASWRTAQDRLATDSAGAITAGRSLFEATCKYVLEECNEPVSNHADLPELYKKAAECLKLDHTKEVDDSLRQILRAGMTMVNGLSHLRNRLGDAHGKTSKSAKPSRRHAALVVTLAGSLSAFLLETLEAQRPL